MCENLVMPQEGVIALSGRHDNTYTSAFYYKIDTMATSSCLSYRCENEKMRVVKSASQKRLHIFTRSAEEAAAAYLKKAEHRGHLTLIISADCVGFSGRIAYHPL